jgi:hypothetical protein
MAKRPVLAVFFTPVVTGAKVVGEAAIVGDMAINVPLIGCHWLLVSQCGSSMDGALRRPT